jgi:hypothetical protein
MKAGASLLLLALMAASPEIRYFHYQRPIENLPAHAGQACLVVDGGIFAHAAAGLADLRLYRDGTETPYVVHLAAPAVAAQGAIEPLNKGAQGGQTVFDAELPDGHYSDLELNVNAQNFIATVQVSGSQKQAGGTGTKLGSFTIFDLPSRGWGAAPCFICRSRTSSICISGSLGHCRRRLLRDYRLCGCRRVNHAM